MLRDGIDKEIVLSCFRLAGEQKLTLGTPSQRQNWFLHLQTKITTHIIDKKKNSCAIATTPPMKKPTAMELWNFRIIIVPPILNANNINADHVDMKPSDRFLVPITANDINVNIPVIERIEYLGIYSLCLWFHR